MPIKHKRPTKAYFFEENKLPGGTSRFYVYYVYLGGGPIKTLFDITNSEDEAKQAIKDHKAGKHATQWEPGK